MSNSISSIGVVILNYTTYQDTIRLVEELQQQTVIEQMRIVVVDNCSPNDSYERLKPLQDRFDNVVVIRTSENLGYAKGNNFGLRYLDENNPPQYVVILNNDVSLEPDCLRRLAARYEELDNAGVIAPLMVDYKGDKVVTFTSLGTTWDIFHTIFPFIRLIFKRDSNRLNIDYTQPTLKVDIIAGSFMFVDFSIFKQIGFFYPNTFLYVEERFVAEQMKRHSYNNYLILDQIYYHSNCSTTIYQFYNKVERCKIWYESLLEYVKVHKKNGRVKALIMRPFAYITLCFWRISERIKVKGCFKRGER